MQSTVAEKQKQKNCEFIDKLLDMMHKNPANIYWTKEGDQLMINNLVQVQTKILPEYFRHQNFASFIRQLNMYGFCKKEKQSEFLRFSHKIFTKGNQNNYYLIQRKAKLRSIRNSQSKFFQSHTKLIEKIKSKSGLTDQGQQLTVSLLQCKQNIQENMRKIRFQLDKLINQLKDTRSPKVQQTMKQIQHISYESIAKSLTKAKQIDEFIAKKFNSEKNTLKKQQNSQIEQCSLVQQIEGDDDEELQAKADESVLSRRFQMGQEELSGFNQFCS